MGHPDEPGDDEKRAYNALDQPPFVRFTATAQAGLSIDRSPLAEEGPSFRWGDVSVSATRQTPILLAAAVAEEAPGGALCLDPGEVEARYGDAFLGAVKL